MEVETPTKLYDIYQGEDLRIAEKIQQRRLQMLVHSYIYYDLDDNIVSDATWSQWATELKDLQQKYPEIEKRVPYRDGFESWDASSGAFLPYRTDEIRNIVVRLLRGTTTKVSQISMPKKSKVVNKNPARKKLF